MPLDILKHNLPVWVICDYETHNFLCEVRLSNCPYKNGIDFCLMDPQFGRAQLFLSRERCQEAARTLEEYFDMKPFIMNLHVDPKTMQVRDEHKTILERLWGFCHAQINKILA